MSSEARYDWDLQPAAGWEEYATARARFLARLGMESRLLQIERAWRNDAVLPPDGARRVTDERERTP
jgi:hypothetical protein